jgi:glycosyltransferase involved in cell wall biosynthesis
MVVSFTGDSGLTDYTISLCRELSKLADVEFVTAGSLGARKQLLPCRVTMLFRRTRHYPIDIWRFLRHVLAQRPQTLWFQSWLKFPLLEWPMVGLLKRWGMFTVLTVHDLLPHYPRPWSRWVLARYYNAFDRLIVHSEVQLAGLRAMGVQRPCLVVPHGVYDIFNTRQLSRSVARRALPELRADAMVVLFFGHLDERKGVADFLAAARRLRGVPNIQFLLAGQSDGRPEVERALELAKADGCAVVHDQRVAHDDVQNYFAATDLVALPYHEGTTSGVMKLALAFQRPVVCTDVGDFKETLLNWPGIQIDRHRLPASLVEGVLAAQAQLPALMSGTENLSRHMQWDHIAAQCLCFLRTTNAGFGEAGR